MFPMDVVEIKDLPSGVVGCCVVLRQESKFYKAWMTRQDLIDTGYEKLVLDFDQRSLSAANERSKPHTLESFQRELSKENSLLTVQPSPQDVYPPVSFRYTRDFVYQQGLVAPDASFLCGCVCAHTCGEACECTLNNSSQKAAYVDRRLSGQQEEYILECNPACACAPTCANRVVQLGVQVKMVLRYTQEKGWGVYAGQNILPGTFIAEYVGELITQEEAKRREAVCVERKLMPYMFDMDFYSENIEEEGIDKSELRSIDAQNFGNVSRFFNHSCDPNMFTMPVFYDSAVNYTFTRIAFFTHRSIKKGEELCFDYEGKYLEQSHGTKPSGGSNSTPSRKKGGGGGGGGGCKKRKTSTHSFTFTSKTDASSTTSSSASRNPLSFPCTCKTHYCRKAIF